MPPDKMPPQNVADEMPFGQNFPPNYLMRPASLISVKDLTNFCNDFKIYYMYVKHVVFAPK